MQLLYFQLCVIQIRLSALQVFPESFYSVLEQVVFADQLVVLGHEGIVIYFEFLIVFVKLS